MSLSRLFSILGPGIIWAATSIGVSHIVQSTRAGADFALARTYIVVSWNLTNSFLLHDNIYGGPDLALRDTSE